MANRILGVLFKKKYANGDTDTIYPKTRAQDVTTSGGTTLETIATKVNGVATGATKVAKSSTNGNILINGAQTVVYTHPNSGATAGTYNKVTVNAQGHVTSGSNVTDWTGTVSGNVSNGTVTSSQASSRSNLASGEKLSVSMGKIRKWFADLKSLAFVDKVGTANLDSTLTTFYNKRVTTDDVTQSTSITEAGWVADARVIRTLQNQINTLNSKATNLENNKLPKTNPTISWDLGGGEHVELRRSGSNNVSLSYVVRKSGSTTNQFFGILDPDNNKFSFSDFSRRTIVTYYNPFSSLTASKVINLADYNLSHADSMQIFLYVIFTIGKEIYSGYIDLHERGTSVTQYFNFKKDNFEAVISVQYESTLSRLTFKIYKNSGYSIGDYFYMELQRLGFSKLDL